MRDQAGDNATTDSHQSRDATYKNGGTDYRPKGDPRRVKVRDFEDKELGKVVPYGVYDISANAGWVPKAKPSSSRALKP